MALLGVTVLGGPAGAALRYGSAPGQTCAFRRRVLHGISRAPIKAIGQTAPRLDPVTHLFTQWLVTAFTSGFICVIP